MYSRKRRLRLFRDPAFIPATGGSISLSSAPTNGSSLLFDNSTGYFNIGSNIPFTVEWFQYGLSNTSSAPRSFGFGNYATQQFQVSMEGSDATSRIFYLWAPSAKNMGSIAGSNLVGRWNHFAIVGDGSNLKAYQNGSNLPHALGTAINFSSFSSTSNLAIGNETTNNKIASFNGYITNFRWVTGTALYSNTFAPPTSPLTVIPGTKLLLLANDSNSPYTDSAAGKIATTSGTVSWSSNSPFT